MPSYPNILNTTKGLFAELAQAEQAGNTDTANSIHDQLADLAAEVEAFVVADGEEDTRRLLEEVKALYGAAPGAASGTPAGPAAAGSGGSGKRTTKAAAPPEAAVPPAAT